ncbi:DUF1441 family protein [Vibrio parahaemolyticus]|jgi:transcriptional regulator with XRE-family HTH domain|uniref:DUF1441 family protein n=1 Tax=Vibrio TaxID=662 RepID=UPI00100EF2E4|nr:MULTISPECIES: DUF1441 family protein [Vibrio]EGQ9818961.1 DUF1441 family protein [Vibrio parahaemolyticus]EGR0268347.1 DUF1441 family protein [Vibrio alginolyticus]EHZ2727229.1 DUF1441 family protein [Vibrio parahaemolyticus]EIV1599953.1 DUF1441 family protein [Vibrio parahaemolyticus]ELH9641304.1 DUF1441 family protein [Vibrio alginolyticus]
MSDISKISTAFEWSISKMAEAFGMSRNTVSKRLRAKNVPASGQVKGSKVYHLKDAAPALFESDGMGSGNEHNPDDMPPDMRKAWFQSENERVKLEKTLGQLCEAHDVAREMALMAKSTIQVLETLPDILERDCGLQPQQVSKVQAYIDDLRDQLALTVSAASEEESETC